LTEKIIGFFRQRFPHFRLDIIILVPGQQSHTSLSHCTALYYTTVRVITDAKAAATATAAAAVVDDDDDDDFSLC